MINFQSNPIFIGGDGRSGTTLLSLVLDSHSQLVVGPELHYRGPKNLGPYIRKCLVRWEEADTLERKMQLKRDKELNAGINFIMRCHRFGIDSESLDIFIIKTMDKYKSEIESFEERSYLIDSIGNRRNAENRTLRWGIKIMRDIKIGNWYHELWPNAQFIHIIRDGRDVAASQIIDHGSWGYKSIESAAIGWVDIIEKARKNIGKEYLLEIRYEDLVLSPKATVTEILKFLNIPWEDRLLEHHKTNHTLYDHPYNHPSIDSVVQPINPSSIGRYTQNMSEQEIHSFNRIAEKYLKEFGYL